MRKTAYSPPTACKRVVSGTISLPSQGFFSPFPHGTGSLSVANKYLALPDGPGRFPQGSTCPAVLRSHLRLKLHFHLRGCHPLWPAFPDCSINAFLSLVVTTGCHPYFLSPSRSLSKAGKPLTKASAPSGSYCGPATPNSPFESLGLGWSDFARHYFRNHGCFLFL